MQPKGMPKGTIDVQILSDGTVRTQTGDMSGPTHKAADDFLKLLATYLGGDTQEQPVEGVHHHHHHDHDHHHDHHHEH